MIVLGIDPGTQVCGYGAIRVDGTRVEYIDCGVLTAKGRDPSDRILTIGTDLEELIAELELADGRGEMAIEEGFIQHLRGALALGEVRGVLRYVARRRNVIVHGYAPSTVKKAVGGSGRADKALVSRAVCAQLGLRKAPAADATDALAIAICHARSY